MTNDLISRARAGDGEAFRALTEPHRRELHVHCYRMLGSLTDAEDALQETMLSAWRGLDGFGERASMRTWLYRIATNTCLNAIRAVRRRPAKAWDIPGVTPPEPTRTSDVPWLEPYPDTLLEGGWDLPVGPEARHEQSESISLAFIAALQVLPPRQLAVLVLRDVLGFRASEVAEMLDATVASVNSSLLRARAGLEERTEEVRSGTTSGPLSRSTDEATIAARFVAAYESGDVESLVALFTDDIFMSMPPLPLEYVGVASVRRFFELLLLPTRRYRLLPTRANGDPAFGAYVLDDSGVPRSTGLFTMSLSGDRIAAMSRFEAHTFAWFGLPMSLD